jgi:hypothetical protein
MPGGDGGQRARGRAPLARGPAVTVPASGVMRTATGPRGARASFQVTATDAGGAPLTPDCRPASGSWFPVGRTTVSCTAVGAGGARGSGRFVVTVVDGPGGGGGPRPDTVAPTLAVPAAITRELRRGSSVAVTYAVSANDAADGALTPSCRPPSGAAFGIGSTRVSCRAVDEAGNVGVAGFVVSIVRSGGSARDHAAPLIATPGAIARETDHPAGEEVAYRVTATDAVDGAVDPSCVPASGSTFAVGTTTVRCMAADRAGNTAVGSFSVVLRLRPDRAAPRIRVPSDVSVVASGAKGAVVTYDVRATDDRDGNVPVRCTPPSGSVLDIGRHVVACAASDRAGNVARATFAVSVAREADTTRPVITVPDAVTAAATDGRGAVVEYRATAMDDRDGRVATGCAPASGSRFGVGRTSVTCTATDAAGNRAQRSFAVEVTPARDRTPPVLVVPPSPAQMRVGDPLAGVVSATDDRDPQVTVDCTPRTVDRDTRSAACRATDDAGNRAEAGFGVEVVFDEIP